MDVHYEFTRFSSITVFKTELAFGSIVSGSYYLSVTRQKKLLEIWENGLCCIED